MAGACDGSQGWEQADMRRERMRADLRVVSATTAVSSVLLATGMSRTDATMAFPAKEACRAEGISHNTPETLNMKLHSS
jgi:hypothetical protein